MCCYAWLYIGAGEIDSGPPNVLLTELSPKPETFCPIYIGCNHHGEEKEAEEILVQLSVSEIYTVMCACSYAFVVCLLLSCFGGIATLSWLTCDSQVHTALLPQPPENLQLVTHMYHLSQF